MSRETVKALLARLDRPGTATGATLLIYHRVGGGSPDERDVGLRAFEQQLDVLAGARVVPLDDALERLRAGDASPTTVLTLDDGFADVYRNAWPMLRERRLPFLVYVASAYVGGQMHWPGSTATAGAPGLTWDELAEMVASGLCTVGNHTHSHARPRAVSPEELDRCTAEVERHLGVRPRHFAYPWGVVAPRLSDAVRARFASAATGDVGRNLPDTDRYRLRRVPVRRSDPPEFFRAKVTGSLWPERAYASMVWTAKRLGVHG